MWAVDRFETQTCRVGTLWPWIHASRKQAKRRRGRVGRCAGTDKMPQSDGAGAGSEHALLRGEEP